MIGCTVVVSVSTSYGRHDILAQSSLSPYCILMPNASWIRHGLILVTYIQRRYIPVSLHFTTYIHPFYFLKSLPKCNLSSSLRSLQLSKIQKNIPEVQNSKLHYLRMQKVGQNNLQLQLMYCTSISCMGHIFQIKNLRTQRVENHWKVVRCIIANTRREMLVLVDFQNDYYSIDYQIIYQLVYLGQLSEI